VVLRHLQVKATLVVIILCLHLSIQQQVAVEQERLVQTQQHKIRVVTAVMV
jgi:hypothetical protein